MKKTFSLITVMLVSLLYTGVASAADVKIGLMAPITGAFASEGQDMQKLLELMVEETNNSGGINGSKVELLVEDDGSTPRSAATAASRLVAKGAPVVIGTYGSAVTEASQDIYDEAGIVQIGTGSTSIRLTAKGMKRFFRTCPRDDEQGRVAQETLQKLGYKRVAILHDNSAYAKGLADETKALIDAKKSAEIIFFDALVPGERDYSAILTKLKGVNPDAIFFTGYYPEAGQLLRQMAEMKFSIPLLGGDATNNLDLVKIAGPAAEGYHFISPPMPADIDNPAAKELIKAYVAKYKSQPSSIWVVLAGDAYLVLVEAIKHKGPDAGAIAEYLHKDLKDFEGMTGKISFDDKGDRVGDIYRLYKVDEKGNFILQPK
ncbi:branched-chain amino acid ABC transporter substrate-binding protein [Desulfosarcina sp. OttesenSCG-928-A07]|nr:branched-chain amino acid ABC transporter substrate-binding protein [Desulfosarcina sp. OttesenSCG-928-A07]